MKAYFNEQPLKIYETIVYPAPYLRHETGSFVNFRMSGKGVLKIECGSEPKSVVIRPKRLGLTAKINGNVIEITIDKPCSFSVEPSGDIIGGLMVFANGKNDINPSDYENIIKFDSGRKFVDVLKITKDNTLLYLDDDAYLDGKVVIENCSNVAICGGIISMEKYFRRCSRNNCVQIRNCKNVKVRDLTILDSCNWSMQLMGCDNVSIDNYHVIGYRGNSDGLDVCGSRNVHVTNCFTRVWDDSLVVKAFDTGNTENVVFENCVLWNDFARPIEVGVELRAEQVCDVHFRNIDIIHSPTGYPVLGIHHGDRAEVHNITFEDINIEDAPGAQIFDIRITDSVWNKDDSKGDIHDVLFKNISVDENDISLSPPRIHGFDEKSSVKNVIIDNVRIDKMAVRNSDELKLITNEFVDGVKYIAGEPPYINTVKTDIEVGEYTLKNGYYHTKVTLKAENISEKPAKGSVMLQVLPSNRAQICGESLDFDLKPQEMKSTEYEVILPPGKFVIAAQSADVFVDCAWKFVSLDMILGEDIENAAEYEFTNCRGEKAGRIAFALKDDLLTVKSELLKTKKITLYAANSIETAPEQVMFSCEETDFAKAPAVINGAHGLELAPQLRCPAEITYVFENEPKTKITKLELTPSLSGEMIVSLDRLGIEDSRTFWLDAEAETDMLKRYPLCLFASQVPEEICHMFANVRRKKEMNPNE